MEEVKKEAEELKNEIEGKSIAMSLLRELKAVNKRLNRIIIGLLIVLAVCNVAWVWLWQQYDYVSTSSYEANGIYALIDSNGNIVSQDITPETWEAFTKWWEVNGISQKDDNESTNKKE